MDLHPRRGRRRLRHRNAGAGPAGSAQFGFLVPRGTIDEAVRYIERCSTPEGGICIRWVQGAAPGCRFRPRPLPRCITPANTMRRSPSAASITSGTASREGATAGTRDGHSFYCQLYASQAFYMSGDEYWDKYFPRIRDHLLSGAGQGGRIVGRRRHRQDVRNCHRPDHSAAALQIPPCFSTLISREAHR